MYTLTPRQASLIDQASHVQVSAHYTPQGELRVKFQVWDMKRAEKLGTFTAPWDYSLNTSKDVALKHLAAYGVPSSEFVAFENPKHYTLARIPRSYYTL